MHQMRRWSISYIKIKRGSPAKYSLATRFYYKNSQILPFQKGRAFIAIDLSVRIRNEKNINELKKKRKTLRHPPVEGIIKNMYYLNI